MTTQIPGSLIAAAAHAPQLVHAAVHELVSRASDECTDFLADVPAHEFEKSAALDAAGELYDRVARVIDAELTHPGSFDQRHIRALLQRADQAARDGGVPLALVETLVHLLP
ncbi:hypothetical protein P3T27_007545 [Kitasatospora sp. MAA19]|uniref:hypothetical protein n=1 Tax=unclassified Kitasatospora TaxID=2633591 RepID=UPI002474C9EF|nr:hypothetical protein [Kitasatospora sp. MAA19]MDH6710794.1 hypothetical protein [Kitasatospora sp. MAA19]